MIKLVFKESFYRVLSTGNTNYYKNNKDKLKNNKVKVQSTGITNYKNNKDKPKNNKVQSTGITNYIKKTLFKQNFS